MRAGRQRDADSDTGPTFGIDARAAAEVPAGRGRVVRELLRALARLDGDERYLLYARETAELELDERFEWRLLDLPDPAWHLRAARLASRDCDAFLSTNSYLTCWLTTCPSAIVVYDLVAFVGAQSQRRASLIEHATIDVGVRRAQALVCISEATRADLVRRVPSAAPRCVVVPLAADERFAAAAAAGAATRDTSAVAAKHGIGRPYVMAAGTLEPRKNLVRLLQAWAALRPDLREDYELVLVGPVGWDADEIVSAAKAARIVVAGYVPDDELAALYAGCTLFCYPSLYEGFGLPVLEAMAAGAPVLTSNVSSLPEVAGDAAVLVDPLEVDLIGAALTGLLDDPAERERLRAAGFERAAQFSWRRTATEMRGVLRALRRMA
jgi:glycosyltransferase involved in cell wall biosynthesis